MRPSRFLSALCMVALIDISRPNANPKNEEQIESTTPDFIATPITGPFLEEAYYDCLMEAKWQLDDQRFHIKSIKQSYEFLCKRGMKMPEFLRILDILDEFYNDTAKLVGMKMRGEEESDEKYDPLFKTSFLKISHYWKDLIDNLDKQEPRYNTGSRIKKMRREMDTAANTSHRTYYLISELQTDMQKRSLKPWSPSATKLPFTGSTTDVGKDESTYF